MDLKKLEKELLEVAWQRRHLFEINGKKVKDEMFDVAMFSRFSNRFDEKTVAKVLQKLCDNSILAYKVSDNTKLKSYHIQDDVKLWKRLLELDFSLISDCPKEIAKEIGLNKLQSANYRTGIFENMSEDIDIELLESEILLTILSSDKEYVSVKDVKNAAKDYAINSKFAADARTSEVYERALNFIDFVLDNMCDKKILESDLIKRYNRDGSYKAYKIILDKKEAILKILTQDINNLDRIPEKYLTEYGFDKLKNANDKTGIFENTTHMTFKSLFKSAPIELQELMMKQWQVPQNPTYHPEGNTLKHIMTVVNRAITKYPKNINLILASFFHDLGKFEALGWKNGIPTQHGHEDISAKLVIKYADWIHSLNGDIDEVYYIVKNHMKIKPNVWDVMRDKKKKVITDHPAYPNLQTFGTIDKGGLQLESHNDISLIDENGNIVFGTICNNNLVVEINDKNDNNIYINFSEKTFNKFISGKIEEITGIYQDFNYKPFQQKKIKYKILSPKLDAVNSKTGVFESYNNKITLIDEYGDIMSCHMIDSAAVNVVRLVDNSNDNCIISFSTENYNQLLMGEKAGGMYINYDLYDHEKWIKFQMIPKKLTDANSKTGILESAEFDTKFEPDMAGSLVDKNKIGTFMFAGKAIFTIRNNDTGKRFTFRIRQLKDNTNVHFVSVMTHGNEYSNHHRYSFFGTIFDQSRFKFSKQKSQVPMIPLLKNNMQQYDDTGKELKEHQQSVKVWYWFWKRLMSDEDFPSQIQIWHEGVCGKCGKKLTVPESIEIGLGPHCAKTADLWERSAKLVQANNKTGIFDESVKYITGIFEDIDYVELYNHYTKFQKVYPDGFIPQDGSGFRFGNEMYDVLIQLNEDDDGSYNVSVHHEDDTDIDENGNISFNVDAQHLNFQEVIEFVEKHYDIEPVRWVTSDKLNNTNNKTGVFENLKSFSEYNIYESLSVNEFEELLVGQKIKNIADHIDTFKYAGYNGLEEKEITNVKIFQFNSAELKYTLKNSNPTYTLIENYCTKLGYSIGRHQAGAPTGIKHGEWDIHKWRNLYDDEKQELDGVIVQVDIERDNQANLINETYAVLFFDFKKGFSQALSIGL